MPLAAPRAVDLIADVENGPIGHGGSILRRMDSAGHTNLEAVLRELYDREINCGLQTFFDSGIRAWLGDELNGRAIDQIFAIDQVDEAVAWLLAEANRRYPPN